MLRSSKFLLLRFFLCDSKTPRCIICCLKSCTTGWTSSGDDSVSSANSAVTFSKVFGCSKFLRKTKIGSFSKMDSSIALLYIVNRCSAGASGFSINSNLSDSINFCCGIFSLCMFNGIQKSLHLK